MRSLRGVSILLATVVVTALAAGPARAQILPLPPSGQPEATPPAPPVAAPGPLGTSTTHFRADAARRGAILGGGLRPPLRSLWRRDFRGLVSSAVVGGGRVFVYSGRRVTALDLATGRTVWTSAAQVGGALAYGGGKVITTGSGAVIALDATTGAVSWTATDGAFGSSPLIAGDLVVVQGQGLTAYDLGTGARRWRGGTNDGTDGDPAAAGDRVFQYGGCTAAAADRRTGRLIWSRNSGCSGGGGGPVVLHRDQVYSDFGQVPLAAGDGRNVAGPKLDIVADGVGLQGGEGLSAVDLERGTLLWTSKVDDSVTNDTLGATLAVGQSVFQTRFEGTLQARALRTGAVTWRGRLRKAKQTFTGSDSAEDFSQAAGDGVLVVLRGDTVDGLGSAVRPPSSVAITVPRFISRLRPARRVTTVRGRVRGNLYPTRVALTTDPYPFGRFGAAVKTTVPGDDGKVAMRFRPDRNTRVRLVGTGGSSQATRAYTVFAYPRIRFGFRLTGNRVRTRVRVAGRRGLRFRGRRVHLYLVRVKSRRVVRLGTARLRGPRTGSGRAVIRFRRPRSLSRRDYFFACVPRVHRLGQGAPDFFQVRCGRRAMRY